MVTETIITWGRPSSRIDDPNQLFNMTIFQTALPREYFASEYKRLKNLSYTKKFHNCWQQYQTPEASYFQEIIQNSTKTPRKHKTCRRLLEYQIHGNYQRQVWHTESTALTSALFPKDPEAVIRVHNYVLSNDDVKLTFEIIVDPADDTDQKALMKSVTNNIDHPGTIYQIRLEVLNPNTNLSLYLPR